MKKSVIARINQSNSPKQTEIWKEGQFTQSLCQNKWQNKPVFLNALLVDNFRTLFHYGEGMVVVLNLYIYTAQHFLYLGGAPTIGLNTGIGAGGVGTLGQTSGFGTGAGTGLFGGTGASGLGTGTTGFGTGLGTGTGNHYQLPCAFKWILWNSKTNVKMKTMSSLCRWCKIQ